MSDLTLFLIYLGFGLLIFFFADRMDLKEQLRIEKNKNQEADAIISSLLKKQECPLWSHIRKPPS